jgi:hypothetical protein
MKKTLHIDEKLLRDARRACGAGTDMETVRPGLEALPPSCCLRTASRPSWIRAKRHRCVEAP